MIDLLPVDLLRERFGDFLQTDVPLAKYTSARIGGKADAFLIAQTSTDLAEMVEICWELGLAYLVIGGGSNMLVSDAGVRELVILNKSRKVSFDLDVPSVWAESGVNFGAIARQAGRKNLAGMEWAAGIPGTVGGAVVGNAGAHGGDTAGNLILAEVLHRTEGRQQLPPEELGYAYRSSKLKRQPGQAIVLSASFRLAHSSPRAIKEKMDEYLAFRRRTQPPGASMGSMFKNPDGDYAGRLIDAAGLKGARIGDAQISDLHANFFINHGDAAASDVYALISKARQTVAEQFGVQLELEIELVGDWEALTK
ncbi:MAG: UDP-N-acetylmuramate dehydrogenase [Anaerolineales bacterium]|jgi:UDP-N-acetylmuramate dehydrogenase